MNALTSIDGDIDWKVVRSDNRGKCAYQAVQGSAVAVVDFTQNSDPLPTGFGRLDDLLDEFEADSDLSEGLAAARREIGERQLANEHVTLSALRMAQGLSQTELAAAIGSTQPAVSRLEAGTHEPRLGTLRRLSDVLRVDMNTLATVFPK